MQDGRRRKQRREEASRILTSYLDAVSTALSAAGFIVHALHIEPGRGLDARITVAAAPGPNGDGEGGLAEKVELAWAEDVGWSVTVPSTDTFGGPTRYLHLELVPSPAVVVQFLTAVLLDGGEVGMPYPAHFRLRSQPLQPLLDALGRCGGTRERVGRERKPNDLDQCLAALARETSTARASLHRDDHRAITRR